MCKEFTTILPSRGVLQAVVLEGKYWKRRLQSVATEYMKWRRFYKSLMRKRSAQASGLPIKAEVREYGRGGWGVKGGGCRDFCYSRGKREKILS